ncbi:adenylyltransferase/cytidyltransferase family protein [Roseofilum sp. BLCC_M154]|uniref:Adenylyltransferase/cytidyltransferase family protein n=1 Tax=Roseofilum acuticapitatum BLCC-M154 TaxID=3022444 RepID=A0ABT7AVH7_9CYAN|nr:adenylyltransferase/cytidyltransferase family protein [Roseofilum acuticapitatum]MDJ1170404.1 adenylyltransferase/cytidyltransferase family protein [Roseofilum acuticapitatum BLCC-M154]
MTIYTLEQLQTQIAENSQNWRPLVLTNGCFDLLHIGHLRYLQQAKSLGRSLIVGINSDRSVRNLKPNRPIVPEAQRAELVMGLKPVDGVVIFDSITAIPLIETLQPDIYAKGGDYTPETLPEMPAVRACGCRLELIQMEVATSTSGIINKILGDRLR